MKNIFESIPNHSFQENATYGISIANSVNYPQKQYHQFAVDCIHGLTDDGPLLSDFISTSYGIDRV